MKLPKLKKTNKVGVTIHFGEKYIMTLPKDSAFVKALPKFVDVAMERSRDFEDKNKLQIELQHLCDLLLDLQTKNISQKPQKKKVVA